MTYASYIAYVRFCKAHMDSPSGEGHESISRLLRSVRNDRQYKRRRTVDQTQETRDFNVENSFKEEGKKPRAPTSKSSLYRVRLQTSGIYNFSYPNLRFGPSLSATGLASLRQKLAFILYITEFGSQLNTSIMPVLTQRIYLGDAHENNQCFFFQSSTFTQYF